LNNIYGLSGYKRSVQEDDTCGAEYARLLIGMSSSRRRSNAWEVSKCSAWWTIFSNWD